ncbi:MAG: tetratricopeptide repeat protein [Promethearchaeota archaeon]
MRKFKINEYLVLRLKNRKTVIYIKNMKFNQCKYLLLEIPVKKVSEYNDISSIDEISEKLDNSLENPKIGLITPKVEFWGHCSNLQAWYENDYNTCLLHRSLAFPLLKELAKVGDPLAKRIFKEEIVIRFMSGHLSVITYLIENHYLDFLNIDEFKSILTPNFNLNIWYHLVEFYFNRERKEKDLNKAIEIFKRILEINPDHKQIWNLVLEFLEFKEFKEVLESNSDPNIWFHVAIMYLNNREYKKAEEPFKHFLKANSENECAWEQMGYIYFNNGKDHKAIGAFKRVLELNPDNRNAFAQLGHLYLTLQKYDKAIESYKRNIKLNPNPVYIMIHLGIVYIKKNEIDNAIQIYKRAFNINPNKFLIWQKLPEVLEHPHFLSFATGILKDPSKEFKQDFLEILCLKLKRVKYTIPNEIYSKIFRLIRNNRDKLYLEFNLLNDEIFI